MNIIKKMLLFMIVLWSSVTLGLVAYYLCYNVNLIYTFDKKETTYNYADEVKNKTLNLDKISNLFTDTTTLIGYPEFQNKLISPVRIEYYKNKNDKSPIYVIEKGEVIYFEMPYKTKNKLEFRGNDSIPTDEKGWRLARPFKIDGETNDSLLYVKLQDLDSVTNEWLNVNPDFANSHLKRVVMDRGLIPVKRNISENIILLSIDNKLYSEGIFLSKDIYKSILSKEVAISFFVTIILISLKIFGEKRFWL